jgi:hypothetical protein
VDTMNEKYTALVRVKCKWFFIWIFFLI